MSHLSKVSIKLIDKKAIDAAAKVLGWVIQQQEFINSYSKESVKDATVLRDSRGKIKYVISPDGTPVVDEYYMHRDYYKFNQEYTNFVLKRKAMLSGAQFKNCGIDTKGNMIVQLTIN